MKSALFAAALLSAGAASAQTIRPCCPVSPMPAPAYAIQPSTTTTTTPATPTITTVAPGNTAPERDARGIPVVSDPAEVPPGFNQPAAVGGTGVSPEARPAPQAASEEYRPCSRTVTDNCVQAYERGRGPNG